jgi:hypothetical protein
MAPLLSGIGFSRGIGRRGRRSRGILSVTGGTIDTTSRPGLTIRTFTSPGTLTIQDAPPTFTAEVLVIGAGGGGGATGGGGGGGAVVYHPAFPFSDGSFSIAVGTGGTGSISTTGLSGGQSEIFNSSLGSGPPTNPNGLRALGGGGGGATTPGPVSDPSVGLGRNGGNGGGGASNSLAPSTANISYPGGTTTQPTIIQSVPGSIVYAGYSGGFGGPASIMGGGGAGAGGSGGNANTTSGGRAGNGGVGVNLSITGTSVNYAAGGGGGTSGKWSGPGGQWWGDGGAAGGASAGRGGGSTDGTVGAQHSGDPGAANRGGGGGGGGAAIHGGGTGDAGNGGPGVVIIVHSPT